MDKKSDGFTLIELVLVIAILGIIAAIAVPRLTGFKSMAVERVCAVNRTTVHRLFESYLFENAYDVDDDEKSNFFNQFLLINNIDKVCPAGGTMSYENGKIKCGVHGTGSQEQEGEEPGDEVPWL